MKDALIIEDDENISATEIDYQLLNERKTVNNKSIANSGAGRWSYLQHIAVSFGLGGRNSIEHQNKLFIFE